MAFSVLTLFAPVPCLQGKLEEEEHFNVALPQILQMIFLDIHVYLAVFWAGDEEFYDKGITVFD